MVVSLPASFRTPVRFTRNNDRALRSLAGSPLRADIEDALLQQQQDAPLRREPTTASASSCERAGKARSCALK